MNFRIKKTLTPNDTGENGSHQAGLHVPKKKEVLQFFPKLANKKNPFQLICFKDNSGKEWEFKFIYDNNKFFGTGTRYEYRITCMTEFFRAYALKSGDIIYFEKKENSYLITFEKQDTDSGLNFRTMDLWEVEFDD